MSSIQYYTISGYFLSSMKIVGVVLFINFLKNMAIEIDKKTLKDEKEYDKIILQKDITLQELEVEVEVELEVEVEEIRETLLTKYLNEIRSTFKKFIINVDTFIQSIIPAKQKQEEKQEENEITTIEKPFIKYENKYLEQYRKMEDIELSKERLDSLRNNIVMENTPLGNVVMFYDSSRSSFIFYSDSTIPYRYLETVGRKYVITNNCKELFVDMEEEIKDMERKEQEKQEQLEQQKQKIEQDKESKDQDKESKENKPNKNVFAKLKKYNTDSMKTVVATGTAKNGPLTRSAVKNTKQQDNKIVKERANRYSYEGKLINFSFLKKVDRKVVDKTYNMSFAEFKISQQNNKNVKKC